MTCSRRAFILSGVLAGLGSIGGVLATIPGCARPSVLAAGRVTVIAERCIGCVRCVNVSPEAFQMNGAGKAELLGNAPLNAAERGAEACPVDAIEVTPIV
ncbi:MAG: ferredoxin [Armatimonadota bacterium]|jgi:ferredoxin